MAEKIAIDVGRGIHHTHDSDALFVRYIDEAREHVLVGRNFFEWSLAGWDGPHRNKALGLALGTRGQWGAFHLDGSIGAAYLAHKTALSGTNQQFIVRVGAGVTVGKMEIGLFATHYSNAKPVFGWDGPNAGYDFLTLQLAYPLR
jgi:hypothetical protein